ncbi:hypothetical protein CHLRE_02g100876v5 [Chlamydomonas reinhardtii]|uniref:Uncharacterized protein n=1 Tax=Chlamydomonas reinhardtii TaxID=3055 RepID=A0A2K3E297_CHLRE|nr:uncharacterized protein CHLRE_02g100876v5 [Chlamydomonas reinhardtii]PNW86910.1 hypothetical protein CHLRE_02g100876v5 [Chlamydomonas reinhardtii]
MFKNARSPATPRPIASSRQWLGGLKEGQRPWSVKVCNDCLTTWNRDVSAANVIRVLLLLKLMGFERPTKLQRPPWPPAAAGPG